MQAWLITGGCGFLGSNLAHALLTDGVDVTVADNLTRHGSRDNLNWLRREFGRRARFEHVDVRDRPAIESTIVAVAPHVVAHLAGQVAMTVSLERPRLDFEVNVGGTLNVLEVIRTRSPETILLYSSTNKVYGDMESIRYVEKASRWIAPDYPEGFDESMPLDFTTPYGCSKGAADQYVLDYARSFGLRTIVFRHSSIYGGRQFPTYDQGWVGWFCLKAVEASRSHSAPFEISGDGKQVRDLLHAEDAVRLYRTAAERIDVASGRAFNVGGGMPNSSSLLELFDSLERTLGVELSFRKLPRRISDQRVFVADNQKARDLLEWAPTIDRGTGTHRMIDWIRSIDMPPKNGGAPTAGV